MQITLRQLKVLVVVADTLNYTQAAERLFLSQPAVSMQIKQLEEQVGLKLFEQVGKKIFLTKAGEEMVGYAHEILAKVAQAKVSMQALKGGDSGRLKVAVATTASTFAIEMLGQFRLTHPHVDIEFEVTNRKALLTHLEKNLLDLVIMGRPPVNPKFEMEAFMQNPLVFIAPVNHPLVGRPIQVDELARTSLVVREEGSGTRQAMEEFFESHGQVLKIGTSLNSNESIKNAVVSGLGVGLVSVHTIELELLHGKLAILDVQDAPIMRYWYLVHHKDKGLGNVGETFRAFLLENAAQRGSGGVPSPSS